MGHRDGLDAAWNLAGGTKNKHKLPSGLRRPKHLQNTCPERELLISLSGDCMGFQILSTIRTKITAFCYVTPCSLYMVTGVSKEVLNMEAVLIRF
jgi:hypothetical protein